jgi:hypothetical protein
VNKGIVIVAILCLLFGCKENIKNKVKIEPAVKCFSAIMFPSHGDTVRHYFVTTYLFKGDSLLILKPDSLYHWKVKVARLSLKETDSINKLIQLIEFKSFVFPGAREKSGPAYCLPMYGLVDSGGKVEIFAPFGKERIMDKLLTMLGNKNAIPTNDTNLIIDYTIRVKRKYLKLFPPPVLLELPSEYN